MAQLLWICSCKGFESGILTSQTAPAVQFLSGLHKMSANSQGALACTILQLDIASSHFIANTADLGGALYLSSVTSGRVIDCVFQDNDAGPDAGQVYLSAT